ncbi:DUF4430 domain-containing protein [candidate division KSB1 bacterium]|nr:MAG: DUF4430 domain-containing protein [candidate division KSB1 bacterium]MBC6947459.1 DUF4430 domain-containing protein [candidate division KSB1 bacterium]MCE7943953.1 DUF4430 domain-containing protein [Chlorobi bacterium CHB1]MDL1877816.1 DUF4430 domain-containing protein [Cytophagia bacterium CHB2]
MTIRHTRLKWFLSLFFVLLGWSFTAAQTANEVSVTIEIFADSTNHLVATLRVPAGANAREVMDKHFKMDYADFTHRFVSGIAGFKAAAKDRKFWKLEIDGEASKVGIAEVKITKPMRLRWVMASF